MKKDKVDKQQKIIDDEVKSRQEKCKENRIFLAWIQANKLWKKSAGLNDYTNKLWEFI